MPANLRKQSRVSRQQTLGPSQGEPTAFWQGPQCCATYGDHTQISLHPASLAGASHRSGAEQARRSVPSGPLTSRARSSGISGSKGTPTASIVSWRSYRGMSGSM